MLWLPALALLAQVSGPVLFMTCSGDVADTPHPTVILEAGGGATSGAWKAVQAEIHPGIRTCAYDRAGSGQSTKGPEPRSMAVEIRELRTALEKAGISGPIVYVGHSLGGLMARFYQETYPEQVAGMVLVDPTDENDVVYNLRLARWAKVLEIPQDALGDAARHLAESRKKNPAPLGDKPLIVIGAGKRTQPPGTSAEQWQEMRAGKELRIREAAKLSRNSRFILDPQSGHNIPNDNPKVVAEAIVEVAKGRVGR